MSNAITSEQRTWLKELGRMVGAPAGVETSEDDVEADRDRGNRVDEDEDAGDDRDGLAKGVRGEQTTRSLLGIPIPLPESIVSQITIRNKSDAVIELVDGSAKLENATASFVDSPPFDVPAGSDKTFSVTNAVAGTAVGGTGGEVKYVVAGDAKKVQLFMKWERGGILPSRKATATLAPSDPRFEIKGRNSGENFQFEFTGKGGNPGPGPGPGPTPGPTPGAAAGVPSSCMIIVTNQTDLPLTRSATAHDRGNFGVPAPRTIAANSSVAFSSVETPGAAEQGCKGFIEWQVGAPAVATWRVEWDNPEQQKNTSSASLTPQTAGFSTQDIIGQGEDNVPVSFALSGGPAAPAATTPSTPEAAPGATPIPGGDPGGAPGGGGAPSAGGAAGDAGPPLTGVRPFEISDSVGQGGKNLPDDVSQVQAALNRNGAKLNADGKSGPQTVQAIKVFQQKIGVPPDGLVEVGRRTAKALAGQGGGGGGGGGGAVPPGGGGSSPGSGGSAVPPGSGGASPGSGGGTANPAKGGAAAPVAKGGLGGAVKGAAAGIKRAAAGIGGGAAGAGTGPGVVKKVEQVVEEIYEGGKKIVEGVEKKVAEYYQDGKKAAQGAEQGIEKKARQLYEEGKQAVEGAEKTADEYYQKAKQAAVGVEQGVEQKANELYQGGKQAVEAVEKKVGDAYNDGKKTVEGMEKRAEKMIDDAKELIPQIDMRNLTGGLLGGDD